MKNTFKIDRLVAREVLDSRGFPTVEVELFSGEKMARALVPSGASTGEGEALELRDGDPKRFGGKGVLKAVENVRGPIAQAIVGKSFESQQKLDEALLKLDGTPNKSKLGANAILAVSMAAARLRADLAKLSLWQQIALEMGREAHTLPVPLMNIVNGGKHADNGLAIQEFMIVPAGFLRFSEALRAGSEVFHRLKKILHSRGLSTGVGDEGGFAPAIPGEHPHEQVLELLLLAIREAGFEPGKDIFLALDCAASEFSPQKGLYDFEGKKRNSAEMIEIYARWVAKYPILSIEDGLSEHDWEGWAELTRRIGSQCQIVGDDLFVTNPAVLAKGIEREVGNAILIKLNQIGTVTETLDTMKMASIAGYAAISSHRSGETEDAFIADLAVGTNCGQIKTGSASRTDRIAKYNQLLRIEEALGSKADFPGRNAFIRRMR
jgi:enolase